MFCLLPVLVVGPLFEPVCVPEGVERVFCTAAAGTDAGDHDCFAVLFAYETVPQDHSQLAAPEGHVLGVEVDRPDALLQRQKGLVYLSPFHPPLLVVRLAVLRTFRPRQVNHQHFTLTF